MSESESPKTPWDGFGDAVASRRDEIEKFKFLGLGGIIEDSRLGDRIAIIADQESAKHFPGCVCYTVEEAVYLLSLDDAMARKVHKMKKLFGGRVGEYLTNQELRWWEFIVRPLPRRNRE